MLLKKLQMYINLLFCKGKTILFEMGCDQIQTMQLSPKRTPTIEEQGEHLPFYPDLRFGVLHTCKVHHYFSLYASQNCYIHLVQSQLSETELVPKTRFLTSTYSHDIRSAWDKRGTGTNQPICPQGEIHYISNACNLSVN